MDKWYMLIRSRKFWASLVGLAAVLILHFTGQDIPTETIVDAIVAIIAVFVGATALEDGLRG